MSKANRFSWSTLRQLHTKSHHKWIAMKKWKSGSMKCQRYDKMQHFMRIRAQRKPTQHGKLILCYRRVCQNKRHFSTMKLSLMPFQLDDFHSFMFWAHFYQQFRQLYALRYLSRTHFKQKSISSKKRKKKNIFRLSEKGQISI